MVGPKPHSVLSLLGLAKSEDYLKLYKNMSVSHLYPATLSIQPLYIVV